MIAIGCDHAGYELKCEVMKHLDEKGIDYIDVGCHSSQSVHYPIYAYNLCKKVVGGEVECGILICGTGIGMSMAANKVKGIRAAVCSDEFSTEFTRRHNDANVMCMGARVLETKKAIKLVDIFLGTPFEGGKHKTRIGMIANIENGICSDMEEE